MILPSVSVIICCFNSSQRLPPTLSHIADQQIPDGLKWEVLLVDNASTDNTAEVALRFARLHQAIDLRVTAERTPGLAAARQRGMAEARYDILLFVDDDNWLAPHFVSRVASRFAANPEIGGLGGESTIESEENPPLWFSRYQRWYAISGRQGAGDELEEVDVLWGAGAAFRRQALDRLAQYPVPPLLEGRTGKSLTGGEDHELCHRLRLLGVRLYVDHSLHFGHYMPPQRLTWSYLRKLHYASGFSSVALDLYRLHLLNRNPVRWKQVWILQVLHCTAQLIRKPVLFCRSVAGSCENDDRVMNVELYRGRLAALLEWGRSRYEDLFRIPLQMTAKPGKQ